MFQNWVRLGLQVGLVEVLRQADAQHAAQPDGDIGVAAEIKVDLQGIGVQQHPGPAGVSDLGGIGGVERHQRQRVRQDELLEQPQHQALPGRPQNSAGGETGLAQVFDEALQAVDRTGGEGREKEHVDEVFLK